MHTKGPWIYGNHGIYGAAHEIARMKDPATVRTIEAETYAKGEMEANARLIAAAPDLLEACKAMRDGWGKNLTEPMALINAAIALAEEGDA